MKRFSEELKTVIGGVLHRIGASRDYYNRNPGFFQMERQRNVCLSRHDGIEDDAIDRSGGIWKIAHRSPTRYATDAIVVMPKDVDDYIPNVAVIINDENVLALAHLPTTLWLAPPIVTSLRRCVGNVYYRFG